MKLNWELYFYNLWSKILQSVGAQGISWCGLNGISASGIADVPPLNLKALGIMLLVGAALPALFKFWESTPLPNIVTEETTTTTRTVVKPPNEPIPPATPPGDPTGTVSG